jgi:hypothetical protein
LSFSLYALEVAFPYLIFAAKNKTVSYVLVRREPTNAKERTRLKFSLGFVLLAVPRKDDTVYSIYRKKEKAETRDIQILVRDLSLSLIRNSLLKLSLSLFPASEKKKKE